MKIIGRSGSDSYSDYIVQMQPGELATLIGKHLEHGMSVGSTVDVAQIFKSTQAIVSLGSSIAFQAKALIAAGEHAQTVAETISAAVVMPPTAAKE
jgi:hypothetical protein